MIFLKSSTNIKKMVVNLPCSESNISNIKAVVNFLSGEVGANGILPVTPIAP